MVGCIVDGQRNQFHCQMARFAAVSPLSSAFSPARADSVVLQSMAAACWLLAVAQGMQRLDLV
jgi:hypothetical protein